MPTVPVRSGPSVEQATLAPQKFTAQADPEVLKQQMRLASSATEFAAKIGEIQDKARNDGDALMVLEKRKAFEDAKREALYQERTGALLAEGKNSIEARARATEMLNKTGKELRESLQNDNQKALFDGYLGDQELDINQRLTIHTAQEIKKHDQTLTKSSIEGLFNQALTDFTNIGKITKHIADQEILIRQMGKRQGLDDESINQAVLKQKSLTHVGILTKMASNEMDIGASKYLSAVRGQMTEEDQLKADKMLQESSYRGQSQRIVDQFMKKNLGMDEAIAAAAKIPDPKLREYVEQRYTRVLSLQNASENQRQESIQMNALNLIDQGKGLDAIPIEQWSSLDDNRRRSIMSYAGAKAKGENKATDWQTYYDLKDLAGKNPDAFKKINLLDYQDKLSNQELKQIIDLQTGVKTGKKGLTDGFMSDMQVVKSAMEQAGIKNKKDQAEFMAVIDQEVTLRKPKDNNELRKIVNEKLTRVITSKGFIWDTTKFQYKLEPTDNIEGVKYDSIPQEERLKITETLKKKGLKISEETISELYLRGLKMRLK